MLSNEVSFIQSECLYLWLKTGGAKCFSRISGKVDVDIQFCCLFGMASTWVTFEPLESPLAMMCVLPEKSHWTTQSTKTIVMLRSVSFYFTLTSGLSWMQLLRFFAHSNGMGIASADKCDLGRKIVTIKGFKFFCQDPDTSVMFE